MSRFIKLCHLDFSTVTLYLLKCYVLFEAVKKLEISSLVVIFFPRGGIIFSGFLWGPNFSLFLFYIISSREKFFDFKNTLKDRPILVYNILYRPWRDHPDGDPLWGPNLISFSFNVPLEKSFLILKTY